MTSGSMKGFENTAPESANRHPDIHTCHGHGDSMTESA